MSQIPLVLAILPIFSYLCLCNGINVNVVSICNGNELPSGGLNPLNCTRPNECYDCGSFCQYECVNIDCPCPIQTFRCVDACYCVKGFARNHQGVCIPLEDCPPRGKCPDADYYTSTATTSQ